MILVKRSRALGCSILLNAALMSMADNKVKPCMLSKTAWQSSIGMAGQAILAFTSAKLGAKQQVLPTELDCPSHTSTTLNKKVGISS